ncbi:hypothetical protein [Kibdelosporangium phytohabitans]|uniref:Uncharacterized protein n=1 Tax=Kibdelosporangium phytohabitans TaxID=860235 RepID=A0A0N9HWB0_9PSEU|nr:hypothetical protein [Kibdelosporangium phytohabitans]ALG06374.1 hypothetical protein AOZ06_05045 [Kibdelosporangium phytohabitans]MBE1467517.1 hypothetical protein [Kibdelosporangium phytohabitans]
MPLQLPTDTQHLRLEMRQYEIFGRSLGQGIRRQVVWIAAAAIAFWAAFALLILGVDPLSRFAPMVYIVPVSVFTISATRLDTLGRLKLMRWYDWTLARLPARQRLITNPAMPAANREVLAVHIVAVCELHHRNVGEPVVAMAWRRRRAQTIPDTTDDWLGGVR